MRIISQDKKVDIPYEKFVLGVEPLTANIMAYGENVSFLMGKYETEERAVEVMMEIKRQYADNEIWKLGERSGNLDPFTPFYYMPEA